MKKYCVTVVNITSCFLYTTISVTFFHISSNELVGPKFALNEIEYFKNNESSRMYYYTILFTDLEILQR